MKTLLLALAATVIGFSAEAQKTGTSANSRFAKNYSVCPVGSGYTVCDRATAMKNVGGRTETVTSRSMAMSETLVYMGERNTTIGRGRIRVSYPDDPNGAYEGKEVRTNDGVQKNKVRQLNQYNTSVDLPPNDGGLSDR
jgi:hypothetical protein